MQRVHVHGQRAGAPDRICHHSLLPKGHRRRIRLPCYADLRGWHSQPGQASLLRRRHNPNIGITDLPSREGIDRGHLTIVFAALAVSRWIEHQTGWSIRKFVRTARRYRTFEIQAAPHTITAADPLPGDLRSALEAINHAS